MEFGEMTVGLRVKCVVDVCDYPIRPVPAGSTGVVVRVDPAEGSEPGRAAVRMDVDFPDLAEWDNEIHVAEADDPYAHGYFTGAADWAAA